MMRQLRESTKVIMVVVAVAFVALMVFDWAMDLSGRSAGDSPSSLGTVNGRDVPLAEYEQQYENMLESAREENPDAALTDDQLREVQDQAWESVVTATLLRQEAQRRGIGVRDEEVVQYVKANPPPEFLSSPALQTDGRFDPAKYQQALANPQLAATWALYEANVREQLPLRKLQDQVLAGVTVTDKELEEAWRAANETVRARYLYLDPAKLVPDSAVRISEAEVKEAYERRKAEDFRQHAAARISAVRWEARTTAADTARVKAELDSLRARVAAGEDFGDVAREASQDPGSAERGGDLGFFGHGQMVPEFEQVAFELPPDSVSQPFLSPFGWHILKAGERQQGESNLPGDERVRAQHILLRIEPSEDTFAALEDSAAGFAELASARPDSFAELAADQGLTVERTPPFEQSPVVPGLGRVPEVAEWAFESPAGSVSEPIRSGNFVYVVKVDERVPAGFVPFESVREQVRGDLMFESKLAAAKATTSRATELVRSRGLEVAAAELGLETQEAGPFARAAELPGIGGGNAFVGTAFGLSPGQTGGPVELENGTYYLTVLERNAPDMTALESQRAAFRDQLLQQKAQAAVAAWLEALRQEAEIEDYRSEFLQTAEGDTAGVDAPPLF